MKMLTIEEVADVLNMNTETIRRYIVGKKLIAYKIGNVWRIKESDLNDFITKDSNIKE